MTLLIDSFIVGSALTATRLAPALLDSRLLPLRLEPPRGAITGTGRPLLDLGLRLPQCEGTAGAGLVPLVWRR